MVFLLFLQQRASGETVEPSALCQYRKPGPLAPLTKDQFDDPAHLDRLIRTLKGEAAPQLD
jgi:hypothetical protein